MDPMSPKLKRKSSNRNRDNRNRDSSAARQPVKAHELRPGNIVWLPQSAIEKSHKILQFEHRRNVQSTDIDQALREEAKNRHNVQSTKIDQGLREAAYNHPVVVLQIINPHSRYSDGDDDYVVVSMLTSFGYSAESEHTCRLKTSCKQSHWKYYLAIYPSTHHSRPDSQLLRLQKGKLEKPSYVRLERVYVPISVLRTYKQGSAAKASDIDLTVQSLDILLREVGIKAPPQYSEGHGHVRGPVPVGGTRATTAAINPLSPSLQAVLLSTQASPLTPRSMPYCPQIVVPKDMLGRESEPGPSRRGAATVVPSSSPSPLATRSFVDTVVSSVPPHEIPTRPLISAREDSLLSTTNPQRLPSQPVPLSYMRGNYGSTNDGSLPPPITWNPRARGSTSIISHIFNSISRADFHVCPQADVYPSTSGPTAPYIPWAAIGSIFTNIGPFFTSIWSSCWGFVANNWHTIIAWPKSLLASTK